MAKKVKKVIPWITIFGAIAVIGLVAVLNSETPEVKADVAAPEVTVSNTIPVASDVHLNNDADIVLLEYTTKSVSVTSTVTDNNGCADLVKVTMALYKDGTSCLLADDNDNDDCYFYEDTNPTSTCTVGNISGTFTHSFDVQYYADTATWIVAVIPYDESTGTSDSDSETLLDLLSLNVSASITYPATLAGATSSGTGSTATVIDTGNVACDVSISGTAMTGGARGEIPVGNQEYASTTFGYGAGTDLSGAATPLNLNLPTPENDNVDVTAPTYWHVEVPTGCEGTFSGTNTFTVTSAI